MITKKKFNTLLQSTKNNIKHVDIDDLNKLQNQFPYCEIIYIISLLKLHLTNDVHFAQNLKTTALYSSNRKHLFQLIHGVLQLPIKNSINTKKVNLFEDWLQNPVLRKDENTNPINVTKRVKKSTQDNNDLTTETLAKIYTEQGHYERAIQAYHILCLKYPKKSGFFANQIKEIEVLIN